MSEESNDLNIDLSEVFLPQWAKESPANRKYLDHPGGDSGDRRERRGRPGQGSRGDRPRRPGPRPDGQGSPGGPRRGNDFRGEGRPRRDDRRGGGGRRDQRRGPQQREERPQFPVPEINVALVAELEGVQSIAKQIRLTGRAYPLFDIAHLIVKSTNRFHFHYTVKKKDGKPLEKLFQCSLDGTLFTDEEEAFQHLLSNQLDTFYKTEKIPTDPPKGTYTLVAQCGMSGELLGPPNYHDYQNKLVKLHQRKFAKMPFEKFKSRVKMVRDEEVVKQWVDQQSFKTEYICLNVPEELRLESMDAVQKHFRETHFGELLKEVQTGTISGKDGLNQPCRGLRSLSQRFLNDQRRFPINVVHGLSQQFAGLGLQFFKIDKNKTHVAVARPRHLDLDETPVSEGVKKIINFIRSNKKCTRVDLMKELAPGGTAEAKTAPKPAEAAPEPPAETEATASESPESQQSAPAPAPAPAATELSPEETEVRNNLHWLIHEGHVVEFANGQLHTPEKPKPKSKKDAGTQPEPDSAKTEAEAPSGTEGTQSEEINPVAATASDSPATSENTEESKPAPPVAEATPRPEQEAQPPTPEQDPDKQDS